MRGWHISDVLGKQLYGRKPSFSERKEVKDEPRRSRARLVEAEKLAQLESNMNDIDSSLALGAVVCSQRCRGRRGRQ
jgi:hypothetical protein